MTLSISYDCLILPFITQRKAIKDGSYEKIFIPYDERLYPYRVMMRQKHLNIRTLIFILLPIAVASVAILWDLQRLDKNFNSLYSLLKTARWDAFYKDTTIIVRFNGSVVTVTNQKNSTSITSTIPTISRVDYDTVMGKGMIVYDWRGTAEYNKRVHGGEIMLKSLLGFRRYIHINCNGMVTEGRYPEDA
jgi:hypothetical protein